MNLIITDYCMPGMTGFELLKKVKVKNIKRLHFTESKFRDYIGLVSSV